MIGGIGVDILKIERIENAVKRSGKTFLRKSFKTEEIKRSKKSGNFISSLARKFAGKEAVFKAFRVGWDTGVKFTELEIKKGKIGEPIVVLSGRFKEIALQQKIREIYLSLSSDTEYAVAFSAILKDGRVGASQARGRAQNSELKKAKDHAISKCNEKPP